MLKKRPIAAAVTEYDSRAPRLRAAPAAALSAAAAPLPLPAAPLPPPPPAAALPAAAPVVAQQQQQVRPCDLRVNLATDVMVLSTPQTGPLRKTFGAIKELLSDLTVVVDRAGGMSISGVHIEKDYVVDTALCFDTHHCLHAQVTFSVSAQAFSRLLNKAQPNDSIHLFVPESSYVDGYVEYVHFQFEAPAGAGGEPGRAFTLCLPTLNEISPQYTRIRETVYPVRVTMVSAQFQKDMTALDLGGEALLIEMRGGDCFFSNHRKNCSLVSGRIHYPNVSDAADSPAPYAARFPFTTVKRVTKCTGLSAHVTICLAADQSLGIHFSIGDEFGHANIYLTPKFSGAR